MMNAKPKGGEEEQAEVGKIYTTAHHERRQGGNIKGADLSHNASASSSSHKLTFHQSLITTRTDAGRERGVTLPPGGGCRLSQV